METIYFCPKSSVLTPLRLKCRHDNESVMTYLLRLKVTLPSRLLLLHQVQSNLNKFPPEQVLAQTKQVLNWTSFNPTGSNLNKFQSEQVSTRTSSDLTMFQHNRSPSGLRYLLVYPDLFPVFHTYATKTWFLLIKHLISAQQALDSGYQAF